MIERLGRLLPGLRSVAGDTREIALRASPVFGLKVVGTALGFVLNVVLARFFGASGAGVYYLSLTVVMIGNVISRFGLDNSLMRFVAGNASTGDWPAVAGAYRQSMRLAAGVSLLVAALLTLGAPWIARGLFDEPAMTPLLRIMGLSTLPASLVVLHAQALKAVRQPVRAMIVETFGVTVLNLTLLVVLGRWLGLRGAAFAYLGTYTLLLGLGYGFWRAALPRLPSYRGAFDFGLLVRTSLPLLWVASMNLVMRWTDTFMLGVWMTASDVGVYGVVSRVSLLTSFVLVAVNSVVAPRFAALYQQGDRSGLERLARTSTGLMTLLSLPLLALFTLFPTFVLGFFGAEFTRGALPLIVLTLGQFVNVAAGSVGYLLMMTGNERVLQYNVIGAAGLNVALNLLLIPRLGVTGAASATAVALAGMNLVSVYLVHRKLAILTLPWPRRSGRA